VKPKPFAQFVTFIYCENLEETCRFYEKVIGLKMVLDQRVCRIYQAAPNAFLGICRKTPPPQDKSAAILTMNRERQLRRDLAALMKAEHPPLTGRQSCPPTCWK